MGGGLLKRARGAGRGRGHRTQVWRWARLPRASGRPRRALGRQRGPSCVSTPLLCPRTQEAVVGVAGAASRRGGRLGRAALWTFSRDSLS